MIFLYTFFTEVFGLRKCCRNNMVLTESDNSNTSIICSPNSNQEKSFQIFKNDEVSNSIITLVLQLIVYEIGIVITKAFRFDN